MSEFNILWPKVVLFGDSLTQNSFNVQDGFWGALLADRLQRKADVIARGFSGYNTRMSKVILPRIFNSDNMKEVSCLVICLGANDACEIAATTRQHIPLEEYCENLKEMIDYLKSIGLKLDQIILMSPPPYDHEKYKAYCEDQGKEEPVRNNVTVKQYAEACCQVALTCGIEGINLYAAMMQDVKWQRFLGDGLHFSSEGSSFVFKLLWPSIEKRVAHLQQILPLWSDINREDPSIDLLPHKDSKVADG
ncbi:isoamyl acetate-hydrolyzing esterase 1 homolog isoform X2 [Limulus polyphemus]|nr:isoamyl acetate-hydrolyzing esterase 1 homolog isoform X2 [Limulus polyphemus]XP_013781625.1 isoamyl acetate-hydrolyzing esterase 1 homolog isoform X2 [Limulus polyphemus]XP_013781626.1 isoamyl acetate-hydrolyzing esterase 1 homolog isoform X2 [Limulus polyphemus]XP_022249599.1 isoamyl acetate-hydrolyzing esterase 1 homolog isoform X2 [Limulus polyphemus]XP_022249600.1 isoamyl acetate-hydrolyzing esterase 1 homolog isoform X2 [Limulus polyphemus]XP_022249601.1 isoamyl acetate-hydrolyzing es